MAKALKILQHLVFLAQTSVKASEPRNEKIKIPYVLVLCYGMPVY